MAEEKKQKKEWEGDVEELEQVFGALSREIPGLIKAIIGSIFSEQAGRDIGKAAAAFYKELKDAGIPEETAVKMTEKYVSVFTNLGDLMKGAMKGETGEDISRKFKVKLAEKHQEEDEEEEDEE